MVDFDAKYKVDVPEGKSGDWQVEKFSVDKKEAEWSSMRATFSFSSGGRSVPEGTYTMLKRRGTTVMSDTPDEIRDLYTLIYEAKKYRGHALINGLGLGILVNAILAEDVVEKVTVVELSKDVIDLVGSHWKKKYGNRLEIVGADALTYKPPKGIKYSVVWHDIWDNICGDNLPDMHKLHRKYGRRCQWQGSWCREQAERNR